MLNEPNEFISFLQSIIIVNNLFYRYNQVKNVDNISNGFDSNYVCYQILDKAIKRFYYSLKYYKNNVTNNISLK